MLSSPALTLCFHHCKSDSRRATLLPGTGGSAPAQDKVHLLTPLRFGWSYPASVKLFHPALSPALLQQLYYDPTHLELLVFNVIPGFPCCSSCGLTLESPDQRKSGAGRACLLPQGHLYPAGCRGSPASLQLGSPECLPEWCHHIVSLHKEGKLSSLPPGRQHDGEDTPAASQVSGTGWKCHTPSRYKCPPGLTPSFCPTCWHRSCMFHIPLALQMTCSPFRAIPGARWGWVSVHQPPQNSICPARAEASAW